MSEIGLDFEIDSVNYDLSYGSPIETNNFKIVHYNVNSILAPDRLEQLSSVCKMLKIRGFQYGGGWGGPPPLQGVVPPHQELSPPIQKILSPPP